MKKIKFYSILSAFIVGVFIFALNIFAEMDPAQRLAIIKALKIKGIVGENNKGYLEFRGEVQAKEVVDAENEARRKVYESVAASTNSTVEQVGINRAAQLAQESPAGTFIQLPDGRWVKK